MATREIRDEFHICVFVKFPDPSQAKIELFLRYFGDSYEEKKM
jgi:hypothetical protein